MFMIVKKYKSMLNMLFDKENYDPNSNFELMRVKAENINKNGPECFNCDNFGNGFKDCFVKLFSCNCCDCEVEEYNEDDSEEIELEIIRKKEERRKRKKKREEKEERESY